MNEKSEKQPNRSPFPENRVYKVVTADALEQETKDGWRLEERYQEVTQFSQQDREPVLTRDASGFEHNNTRVTTSWSAPLNNTYFLVSHEREEYSKLADITEQHRVSQEHIKKLNKDMADMSKSLGEATAEVAQHKERVDGLNGLRKREADAAKETEERHKKTAGDMRKLLEHFGEAQVKAALTVKTLDPKPLERL